MKQAIALIAIVLTFAMGACSSSKSGSKPVMLATCAKGDAGKKVILQENSYAPGGRVVRLAAH